MQILDFTLSAIALALLPGPDILFVMTNALENGWRKSISVILGMCTGNVIYTILTCFGFGKIASEYPEILNGTKYFAAVYLLYLGIMGIINAKKAEKNDIKTEKSKNGKELYLKGLIMNLINPKIMIFFLALFTPFLSGNELEAQNEMLILGAILIAVTLVVFGFAAILCSKVKDLLSEKNMRRMPYISFVIYIGIICLILL